MQPSIEAAQRSLARVVISLLAIALTVVTSSGLALGSDTVTRWDSFSESSNCTEPYTRTPFVSRSGTLSNSEKILGPFGTYFGRTVGEVRSDLRWWTVPRSGGRRILVNRAMLPDLGRVSDALAAEAAKGRVYLVTAVGGFTPRTISGSNQLSRHALGLAIDINPAANPFRSDNRLITNMPGWFVDVWRDAGFCWGGDWRYAKDPMHFSWLGQAPPHFRVVRISFVIPLSIHTTPSPRPPVLSPPTMTTVTGHMSQAPWLNAPTTGSAWPASHSTSI